MSDKMPNPEGEISHAAERSWVNFNQTPEERRAKYAKAREFGATPSQANRMRDWHSPKIFRRFGQPVPSMAERRKMGLLKTKIDKTIDKIENMLSMKSDK